MTIEEEARVRIEREAANAARTDERLKAVEKAVNRLWLIVGGGALALLSSVWEALKTGVFK